MIGKFHESALDMVDTVIGVSLEDPVLTNRAPHSNQVLLIRSRPVTSSSSDAIPAEAKQPHSSVAGAKISNHNKDLNYTYKGGVSKQIEEAAGLRMRGPFGNRQVWPPDWCFVWCPDEHEDE